MKEFITKCIDSFTQAYEWVMKQVLKGKHVQVNRDKYLRKLVAKYHKDMTAAEQEELAQKAINSNALILLTDKQRKKEYRHLRLKYGLIVFWVSFFMTTVPDNMWIVATACVIDLYIFQCIQFRAMQKILMLHGRTIDLNANIGSGIESILSIDRAGIMVGKYPLLQKMKSGLGFVAKQVVQKQGGKVVGKMSRSLFMIVRRQCIKWFSMVVAKEDVAAAFELLIPITCAIISGLVSVIILVPMCNKLRKNILAEQEAQSKEKQADETEKVADETAQIEAV